MTIRKKNFGFEFGIVLLLLSIPISQIFKLVFGFVNTDITSILIIISLFLICNKSNLFRFQFSSMNKWYLLILLFQVYILLIAVVANIGLFTANYGIIYTLFTMVLIIVISTNKRKINYELILKLFIYISGIFNLLLLYYLTDGLASLVPKTINLISVGNMLVADRLTLSTMAYFYLIALLVFHSKNYIDKVCSIVFLFAALLNIIATSRRGLMVALIIILLLHLVYRIRQHGLSKNTLLRIIRFSCICIITVFIIYLVILNIPEIWEQIETFNHRLSSSLITFFGGGSESSYDIASYSRVLARQDSYALLSGASTTEIIFGFGYMRQWIDFPFLQAIIDMGIIFGVVYIYIQIKPIIYTILKKYTLQDGELFFLYLAIVGLLNNFYSGIPYGYYKYLYLIPLLYVIMSETRMNSKS